MAYVALADVSDGDLLTATLWNALDQNIDASDVGIVTTAGDLLTATAANAPARFPITATAGGVLGSNGNGPSWLQPPLTTTQSDVYASGIQGRIVGWGSVRQSFRAA